MKKTKCLFLVAMAMFGVLFVSCEKDNSDTNNGNGSNNDTVQWIDLGLPSGVLWADRNVGSSSPEGYGLYFAWGETCSKSVYSDTTYKFYTDTTNFNSTNNVFCEERYDTITKYCTNPCYGRNGFVDSLTTLQPEDDAATSNWGNGARTPTFAEWQELQNNCICAMATQKNKNREDVRGYLFTGRNGNTLFIPAAGYYRGKKPFGKGHCGVYWSSSLNTDFPDGAYFFYFYSRGGYMYNPCRVDGFSVRPVRSASQN